MEDSDSKAGAPSPSGGSSADWATRFKRLHPKEYYRKFVEKGIRPDGRRLLDVRQTALSVGAIPSADGSSIAKIGNTTVACGIKLEVGQPSVHTPNEGRLEVEVKIAALSSPQHMKKIVDKSWKMDKPTRALAVAVETAIRNTGMLNLEELCIAEGDSVWALHMDIVCLDYSGNLLDAAILSAAGALKSLKLPATRILDDGEVVMTDGTPTPLTIQRYPLPLTFGIFDKKTIFADPTAEEEEFFEGSITIAFSNDGQLCLVQKSGGSPLSETEVDACISNAEAYSKKLNSSLSLFGTKS